MTQGIHNGKTVILLSELNLSHTLSGDSGNCDVDYNSWDPDHNLATTVGILITT